MKKNQIYKTFLIQISILDQVKACVEAIEKGLPEGVLSKEELQLIMELKDCVQLEHLLEEPPSPVKSECFLVIGKNTKHNNTKQTTTTTDLHVN